LGAPPAEGVPVDHRCRDPFRASRHAAVAVSSHTIRRGGGGGLFVSGGDNIDVDPEHVATPLAIRSIDDCHHIDNNDLSFSLLLQCTNSSVDKEAQADPAFDATKCRGFCGAATQWSPPASVSSPPAQRHVPINIE